MAAAMLAAGVAALAVGVVVMITADVGIVCKRACQQGVHRRVRFAADAAVELDTGLRQCHLGTAADTAANQGIHAPLHQEASQRAVAANAPESDFIFKAAAVADYTPANYSDNKVKKSEGDMFIPLKRTRDILKYLGENRVPGQVICGFSMETQNMVENSREKLVKKNVDMICANNLKQSGAGFGVDTNVITIITRSETTELPLQSKESAANAILDAAVRLAP